MERLGGSGLLSIRERYAEHMEIPAEGPSLGMAPSVKCICIFWPATMFLYSSLRYRAAVILAIKRLS